MALCKSGWLYFERSEKPVWARNGEYVHIHRKDDDCIIAYCEMPRDGIDFQKWQGHRILARQLREGTYEVLSHSPFAVFLRFISEDTRRKFNPKQPFYGPGATTENTQQTEQTEQPSQQDSKQNIPPEPELDPSICNAKDARQWLIWREYLLLRMGKVPQGWASVADAFLDRVKEREQQNRKEAEKYALTDGTIKAPPKSERELLNEIITSPSTSPRDKMAAQTRLNELDAHENKNSDTNYAPEPIIKEID